MMCYYLNVQFQGQRVNRDMKTISRCPCAQYVGTHFFNTTWFYFVFSSPVAQQPYCSLGHLLVEVSRSHTDTRQFVGVLWTSDRSVAETSTSQHTALAREKHACLRRDSNLQFRQASDLRSTLYRGRPPLSVCYSKAMNCAVELSDSWKKRVLSRNSSLAKLHSANTLIETTEVTLVIATTLVISLSFRKCTPYVSLFGASTCLSHATWVAAPPPFWLEQQLLSLAFFF